MRPFRFASAAASAAAVWSSLMLASAICVAEPVQNAPASAAHDPKSETSTKSDQETSEPFDVKSGIDNKRDEKPESDQPDDKKKDDKKKDDKKKDDKKKDDKKDEKASEADKKKEASDKTPLKIQRESEGLDVIAGPWIELPLSPSDQAAGRAVRNAQVHLKFGASERGSVQEFEAAQRALDAAAARLAEVNVQRRQQAARTVQRLQRETGGLRKVALTTFFGRFPLIRAFDFEIEGGEEFQVHSYSNPGNARRRAILGALTQIGKSASSGPLHALVLVPGETEHERLSSELAELVDSESRLAFADVANIMIYAGALRADVDPMPAWGVHDPAFDPICRQFLKLVDPEKEPRAVMLVMVRELADELGDGRWVQVQQRTFEASSLEKAEDDPKKLEADKVREQETLTHDRSRFGSGIAVGVCILFLLSIAVHGALLLTTVARAGGWQRWLAIPISGFAVGLALTPLIMWAMKRWLPEPQMHAASAAWWPCTAGALSLVLPAGIFRMGAGSASRYIPSLSCHGRWGIVFVPVALGACAAWIRPACYALGAGGGTFLILSMGIAAGLLVYFFGRAIDMADQFPVAATPIAIVLALVFGGGAFLGSPAVLWIVSGAACLFYVIHAWVTRRKAASAREHADGLSRRGETDIGRPHTTAQLKAALEMPSYQPSPEFDQLKQTIDRLGIAQSSWIGLVGPTVSGKTMAARHLISELQSSDRELQVLVGRCTEGAHPYQPFREALEALGVAPGFIASRGQGGDVNSIFERLADELIPFWDFFSSSSADDEKGETSRNDLLAVVTNALHVLTQKHRVVLFIDDIQWMDEGSEALLKHLRENFAPGGETSLLFIVASRDPKAIERLDLKEMIVSLTPPAAVEQVRFLTNIPGIENGTARRLVEAQGVMSHEAGAMFWLIRSVRELAVENAFVSTSQGFTLRPPYLKRGKLPVPAAIRVKLAESLRASGQYQPVMECAALLGEKFRVDDLAECLGFDRLHLLEILRHLDHELQLVRDVPSDENCYAFSSTFMLEIVREELGIAQVESTAKTPTSKIARELHARIAAVLERRQPRTPELSYAIAHHRFQAGTACAAQSAKACLAAAQVARKQHSLKEARRYLLMAEHSAQVARASFDFAPEHLLIDAEEAKLSPQSVPDPMQPE